MRLFEQLFHRWRQISFRQGFSSNLDTKSTQRGRSSENIGMGEQLVAKEHNIRHCLYSLSKVINIDEYRVNPEKP